MIEDIFLTYANEPSRNNPKFFHTFFSAVNNNIDIDLTGVDEILPHVSDLAKFNSVKEILDYISKNGSINHNHEDFSDALYHAVLTIASDRIYHYMAVDELEHIDEKPELKKLEDSLRFRIDYWKESYFRCDYRKFAKKHKSEDLCENAFLRKCYECFQLGFCDMLIQITKGTEFTDIEDFEDSVSFASELDVVRTDKVIIQKPVGPFHDVLVGEKSYAVGFHEYSNGSLGNSYAAFNEYVHVLATLSLSRFLLKNDRRKLKLCIYCNKFFIAKDIKRKHCCYSSECQKQRERDKKRIQREIDPAKYI